MEKCKAAREADDRPSEIVLVTGGSGFLGQHVVRELQLHDPRVSEVRVLDTQRFVNKLDYTQTKPVRWFEGDVTQPESCRAAFRGVHCVIHCAAFVTYAHPVDQKTLDSVNVEGTRHVVQLCLQEGVTRLVYCSTAEVAMRPRFMASMFPLIVGQSELRALPPLDDSVLPPYVTTKLRAEKLVLAADHTPCRDGTGMLRTIALRPTLLYGELEPRLLSAVQCAADWMNGYLVSPTSPTGRQQFMYAGNAAWSLVLAKDALLDNTDNVAGMPMFITDDTIVEHAFELATRLLEPHVRVSGAWLPSLVTYPLARLAEISVQLLGAPRLSVQPTAAISFLGGYVMFSRLRAAIHLCYMPRYTEEDATSRTRANFKSVPCE